MVVRVTCGGVLAICLPLSIVGDEPLRVLVKCSWVSSQLSFAKRGQDEIEGLGIDGKVCRLINSLQCFKPCLATYTNRCAMYLDSDISSQVSHSPSCFLRPPID
jgi:hypothetical protein